MNNRAQKPDRATINDVAAKAGVHPSTASRALNPNLPGRVARATVEKVRAAAEDLGYQPDPTARSLRTRRSGFVGVVIPDLTNPVLAPIVRGLESVLWEAGLACLLADTDNQPDREAAAINELTARRCEGLVIATAARSSNAVTGLADGSIPTVLVTRETDDGGLPLVAGHDEMGVDAAFRHLFEIGHRRIVHVTGPPELSTTTRREAAYRAAHAKHIPQDQCRVIYCPAFTIEAGLAVGLELLSDNPDFTAVLAGNDMIAMGFLEAMTSMGLRCPEDISIVGHNDMPLMAHINPPLTTVAIPQFDIGAEAARTLLALRSGETVPSRQLLPTRLVIRSSTAPPK